MITIQDIHDAYDQWGKHCEANRAFAKRYAEGNWPPAYTGTATLDDIFKDEVEPVIQRLMQALDDC